MGIEYAMTRWTGYIFVGCYQALRAAFAEATVPRKFTIRSDCTRQAQKGILGAEEIMTGHAPLVVGCDPF
jgi:hypothetical protein